jgi:hypothetical protein
MSSVIEFVLRVLFIGAGATLLIDVWAALRRIGVPGLNFALLGRWLGHLPAGRFVHHDSASATPVPRESLIGWCAHYAIGISFAGLLLAA